MRYALPVSLPAVRFLPEAVFAFQLPNLHAAACMFSGQLVTSEQLASHCSKSTSLSPHSCWYNTVNLPAIPKYSCPPKHLNTSFSQDAYQQTHCGTALLLGRLGSQRATSGRCVMWDAPPRSTRSGTLVRRELDSKVCSRSQMPLRSIPEASMCHLT